MAQLKPGTPVCYIDYMDRKRPAQIYARIFDDLYDLVVFEDANKNDGTVVVKIVRSVGITAVRGSRMELIT